VTPSEFATFVIWSYGLAAVGYLAFAIRMALGWRRSLRAVLLLGATLATVVWALSGVALGVWMSPTALVASSAADATRYAFWFLFVGNLLQGGRTADGMPEAPRPLPRWIVAAVTIALLAGLLLSDELPYAQMLGLPSPMAAFAVRLGLAVFGLMLVEQLMRRAHPQQRWGIKPLCLALAAVFCFDLFLYAEAMLYARLDVDIWAARGIANALVIPLIVVATARNTGWTVDMHISREAVLHSTALLLSGAFLLLVAVGGYFVRFVGGDWGRALQIELTFGALLFLVLLVSSGRVRSKLRVFVSKHFFSYRYDYRKEWLRFTDTLATTASSGQGFELRAIIAVANLVESPAGMLWLRGEERAFHLAARWNLPAMTVVEPADGSLPLFLQRTGWVVSLRECASAPEQYPGLSLPGWLASIANAWLIVPLGSGADMLGFIVLTTPRAAIEVNWEVRDLLKTASHQAASYLGQLRATEALLEARKFDAFNRMSAFVVHDLKNLVAQLSLMIRNAERHRDNPEFQRDMLATVEHVVERMNKLMLQLRTGATPVENPRPVDLTVIVQRVCSAKSTQAARIGLNLASGILTLGDEDRLEHVIGHLVQNALDATATRGTVTVGLDRDKGFAVIAVTDTGVGMSPEFVRDRLFKPFETTKQTGMGIGVYESTQYVEGLGGQLVIDSTPDVGTTVRVLLPLVDNAAAPPAALREVA
jgi:putative PEP-CTERM system histidine kinase